MKRSTKPELSSSQYEIKIIKKLTLVSVIGNILLTSFKMFAGILGRSGAMVSDAIHSMSDVLTTFIAALGVKLSKRSSDKEHPYGHERLECVASIFLGVLLGITGVLVGKAGIESIISGEYAHLSPPTFLALTAAIVSIVSKEAMYWYTRYYAKRINSAAFMADAWHHRSDAISSIGSLIGIGGAMLGFPICDPIASLVICLFILKVTYDILKDAIMKMLDTSCDEEYERKIREFVEEQPEVLSVDSLHTRMFGNRIYVDLEIQVDGNKTLRDAHDIAESVHNSVEASFADVKHIMIHLNPGTVFEDIASDDK